MKKTVQFENKSFPGVLITFIILLLSNPVKAQSAVDTILAIISRNNLTIQANTHYWETRKLEYKTGLFPDNPQVEFDYLKGSPANAGNQTDITVFQSFDFPSSYIKRKRLSDQRLAQAEHRLNTKRQDVLLEAKFVCIDLVYRNKLLKELRRRKENAETILDHFETKLDKGDGNILDVNKARIQLIGIDREFRENSSVINQLNARLVALNGGREIVFNDTVYFALTDIPSFEQLQAEHAAADPLQKDLEQEKIIVQKELELSRTLSYPKFEVGYHYQGILGQTYNGFHSGITLPLWQNKNTVKTKKSQLLFAELEIQDHKNDQYFAVKQLYEKYQELKITVNDYKYTLDKVNAAYLLNKSLTSGHMSAIEYFMEMNYYSVAYNNYLLMEKEYYRSIAELYKFKL